MEKINAAADAAYSKFSKYFADKTPEHKEGLYPARVFLKEIQIFNPRKSLAFNEIPRLEDIPGLANVPPNELSGYRILARDYSFEPSENEDSLEGIAREMQQTKDFWASCSTQLPNLSKLALTYAFCYVVQLPLNDASRTTSYWRMKDKVWTQIPLNISCFCMLMH